MTAQFRERLEIIAVKKIHKVIKHKLIKCKYIKLLRSRHEKD